MHSVPVYLTHELEDRLARPILDDGLLVLEVRRRPPAVRARARRQERSHFEYNHTIDIARHKIYATENELADNWRGPQGDPCSCRGVPVILRVCYGDSQDDDDDILWRGLACIDHMHITRNLVPTQYQHGDLNDGWNEIRGVG